MITDRWASEYKKFYDEFAAIAKHGKVVEPEYFKRRMSALEMFVLDLLKPPTFERQDALDEIIAKGEMRVTPDLVDEVIPLIKQTVDFQYFFDHIQSSEWLTVLEQRGVIGLPYKPIQTAQYIRVYPWPPSRYFARIAASAPTLVLVKALKVDTWNWHTNRDLIDAALCPSLPVSPPHFQNAFPQCLSPKVVPCSPKGSGSFFRESQEAGYLDEAFDLAAEVLAIRPRDAVTLKLENEEWSARRDPEIRIDTWQYEQIIRKNGRDLFTLAPLRTIQFLAELLAAAIAAARSISAAADGEDVSSIWWPTF